MSVSAASSQQHAMDDPDYGWKPSRRPQSTIALNFMSELDDLFKLDGGIDMLDRTVHQKKLAVSTHTQELEALEAKLRETEQRLQQAKSSPPRPHPHQRRKPVDDVFTAAQDTARGEGANGSPVTRDARTQRTQREGAQEVDRNSSKSSNAGYVLVERPRRESSSDEQA